MANSLTTNRLVTLYGIFKNELALNISSFNVFRDCDIFIEIKKEYSIRKSVKLIWISNHFIM
jgi:hypothetical protein